MSPLAWLLHALMHPFNKIHFSFKYSWRQQRFIHLIYLENILEEVNSFFNIWGNHFDSPRRFYDIFFKGKGHTKTHLWPLGIFYVFHVKRFVNIFLLNRKFCNASKLWNTWKTSLHTFSKRVEDANYCWKTNPVLKYCHLIS